MKKIFFTFFTVLLFNSIATTLFAQSKPFYVFDLKIVLPGNDSYDYLSINQVNNRLFVPT